jgi:hypothetical protein
MVTVNKVTGEGKIISLGICTIGFKIEGFDGLGVEVKEIGSDSKRFNCKDKKRKDRYV